MDKKELVSKQMELLQSTDEQVAFGAIKDLKRTGKDAVPALIRALEEEGSLRTMAIVVLGQIGEDAEDAAPYLADLLKVNHEETQMAAALSLSTIGAKSLPYLLGITRTEEGKACFWASWAVAMISPSLVDDKMVECLNHERTSSTSMFAPFAAEEALGKIIAAELNGE